MLCEHVENNLMVIELDLGWKTIAAEKEHSRQRANMTMKLEFSEIQGQTIDDKLKKPVLKMAPMSYESVFSGKNRAGNVGASHQQAKKVDLEHAS